MLIGNYGLFYCGGDTMLVMIIWISLFLSMITGLYLVFETFIKHYLQNEKQHSYIWILSTIYAIVGIAALLAAALGKI